MALLENGDAEGALAVLRRAIALDARTATAHLNLGNALSRSFPDGHSLGLQLRLQQVRVSTRKNVWIPSLPFGENRRDWRG
jgi:hypothetical protein